MKIFSILIEKHLLKLYKKRGDENIENNLTIYGLKPLIIKTINSISNNITELNNSIIVLQNTIGTTVSENNELISDLFTTIQTFLNFDINMNELNQNVSTNKLALFMKYENQKCTIEKNKILPIYLKNTQVLEDYTIELLPEIFLLIESLDLFKINKDNILKIYDDIDEFYNYLGKKNTNMTFQTLYDLFFITNNRSYDKYITYPHQEYNTLKTKYTEINEWRITSKKSTL